MSKAKNNSGRYMNIFRISEYMEAQKEKARLKEEKIKSGGMKPRVTTPAQATHRMKFSSMGKFIGKIKDAVNTGFYDKFKSSVATAIQVNYKRGMIGEYPDVSIFYEFIVISEGNLRGVFFPEIILSATGTAQVSWYGPAEESYSPDNDHVYILIFNSTRDKVHYSDFAGRRMDFKVKFDIPKFNVNDDLHCWIFLKSINDKKISASEYLDNMTVKD